MDKLNFLMLVHNHQPIGNFDHVMEKSFERAYKPFFDIFSETDLKISLHISGPLFDWLFQNHHEFIDQIKKLVKEGRLEIVGSGYYEPIVAAIPEDDAVNQISLYKRHLEKTFDTKVIGSWLTERVWEPHLPKIFKNSGIEYVVTDDYHFLRSGFSYEELDGYYLTDYDNKTIAVYPGSEALRYIMPFSTLDKIEGYFRTAYEKGCKTLIFADDGEKFGIWPETFKWVYEEKWLYNFFNFLKENRDWIETKTVSEHLSENPPKGCCYLPTTSYPELGEWALPSNASVIYKTNLDRLKGMTDFDSIKPFYQGGQWKNFLSKYRESRFIYRKMHYISDKLREKSVKSKMELFKAQCNDAYWHGIFGGLYLPHLRREVNSNIVAAMKKALPKNFVDFYDFDLNGNDELLIKNEKIAVIISPADGGTITSIDFLDKNINLTDCLTRRFEPYHMKISEAQNLTGVAKTIHEQFKVKEEGLDKLLTYDIYERASFRCHLFKEFPEDAEKLFTKENIHDFAIKGYGLQNRSGKPSLLLKSDKAVCKKYISLDGERLSTALEIKGAEDYTFVACEWSFNLFAPDAPDRYISVAGERKPLNYKGLFKDLSSFSIVDEWFGIRIDFNTENFNNLSVYPIYTVSLSEGGVEKTFQGGSLIFIGHIVNGDFTGKIDISVSSI